MHSTLAGHAADMVAPAIQETVHDSLELLGELYDYNHRTYARLRPFLAGDVCEVGCGIGNVTQFLLNHKRVVGVEPFPESIRKARARFAEHRNVRIVQSWLSQCPSDEVPAGSFDSVLCTRVLEYIDDDQGALTRMRELCKPHGSVVLLVAAHPSAYGSLDEEYGHRRRYNRRGLATKFRAAGLEPSASFYMNAPGYFGWLWESRIRRRTKIAPAAARAANRLAPFLEVFERICPLPFGQSLVMAGRPA